MNSPKGEGSLNRFPTTEWTQIIAVIQEGNPAAAWDALVEFCERYRPAICSFFRRHGCSPEQAEDLAQDFFTNHVLKRWEDKNWMLGSARRDESRKFRSFLSHVLWQFLKDEWKKNYAHKRGGSAEHIPLDGLQLASASPDEAAFAQFDREFAEAFSIEMIRKAAERSTHSKYLIAHLHGEMSQREAAENSGITEEAFKLAYHRFRQRLSEQLWTEVSKLVGPDEKDIRAEIEYLMSLFAAYRP